MSEHFTYLNPIVSNPNTQKIITAVFLGLVIFIVGCFCKKRLSNQEKQEKEIVPDGKTSIFSIIDVYVEKFTSIYDSVLGANNRKHLPFIASVFLFIFVGNLLGLIPGMPAITSGVPVTVGMAIVAFIYFNIQGVKVHGGWGYLKHFGGPVLFLCWLIFPLEIFSTLLRILTLHLRLFWNITADHLMLSGVTENVCQYVVPSVLYTLGVFVSFMQAFVFTVLNMVYIQLATEHEHKEEHELTDIA